MISSRESAVTGQAASNAWSSHEGAAALAAPTSTEKRRAFDWRILLGFFLPIFIALLWEAAVTFGLTIDGAGNTAIPTAITGTTATLTKTGAGTLTLSGANTYTTGQNLLVDGGMVRAI